MDKLAKALREDAARIDVGVSAELDARIRASLENVRQEPVPAGKPRARLLSIGWASGLTGIAVAAALILAVNLERTAPPAEVLPPIVPTLGTLPLLNTETAVFTAPLQEELDNLESDLRKAEQAVKREIGLGL